MAREFVFGCVLLFFTFVFWFSKSGITINHRAGLSYISYKKLFGFYFNHIKIFPKQFPSVEKNLFEYLILRLISSERSERAGLLSR